jgi:hypothetical protein
LVEAKKDDIINTFGQCVAQMLGVRIYNQKDGNTIETIYGCVTTGIEWQLLKLENNIITIDIKLYSIKNLPELLGALQAVVNVYK